MSKISFTFGGKNYEASRWDFAHQELIVLPDERVLFVSGGWLESAPPRPHGLEVTSKQTEGNKLVAREVEDEEREESVTSSLGEAMHSCSSDEDESNDTE